MPIHRVKDICFHILLGLDYLHKQLSIIYTDLKPENILLMAMIDPAKDPRKSVAPLILPNSKDKAAVEYGREDEDEVYIRPLFKVKTKVVEKNLNLVWNQTFQLSAEDKEKHIPSFKKQQQDASRREAAATKRMQELMRQFGTILRQIMQHKWAWPFMEPVDVEGLKLHDYYEVINKPMDFNTIKNQMEAKDGTGYKNVREIWADVRLVFKNAMKYNDERSDVHVMAKTLLKNFEKWLQLLPKVTEEEKRREEEEAEAQFNMQLAQEAAHAKMARDLSNELYELDKHLEDLQKVVVQKCKKITTEEKRLLEERKKLRQAWWDPGVGTSVGKDIAPCGQGASMGDGLSQSTTGLHGPWALGLGPIYFHLQLPLL
ncbi:transcription factor GTE6-like [Juglans regia]|uniref:Transcription factor GTE6-like n=1 Tax=Juglans regia TaxID=51240 RepID=A0A2I4G0D7_JUGRE|nr:transcription factor GTE6-like [Juglans regia]